MLHELRTMGGAYLASLRRSLGCGLAGVAVLAAVSALGQPSNTFQFATNAFTVGENTPGFATVTVLFGGGNTSNVTVDYFTSDDTAFAGVDYTATGGSLVFTPGQLTNSFSVIVGDDFIGQGNRQFFANLGASTPGTFVGAISSATVTILDNEIPQPPVNDPFTNATGIFGLSGLTPPATNNAASKEAGEPNHAGNAGGRSVWFRWTAPANGTVTFSTLSNTFDTLLAVYTGNSVNALIPVADNDGFGTDSSVTFTAVAGTVYRIAVDGAGGAEGVYQLNWSVAGSAGVFSFTSSQYEATESEADAPFDLTGLNTVSNSFRGVRITVTRSGGAFGRMIVNYAVSDTFGLFPAANGINYALTDPTSQTNTVGGFTGVLVFDHLQTSASFLVAPIDDFDSLISQRVVAVSLTGVAPAVGESADILPPTIAPTGSTASIIITDDDVGINFARYQYRTDEDISNGIVRVVLVKGAGVPDGGTHSWRINGRFVLPAPQDNLFPLSAGSDYATPNQDFGGPFTGTLTWPAAVFFQTINIPITNDAVVEFPEDLTITLFTTAGQTAPIGASGDCVVTIVPELRVGGEHAPGSVDPLYNPDYSLFTSPPNNATPGANNTVNAVAVQADGKSVVAGEFTSINGVGRNRIARMNSDGSLDTSFAPGSGANSAVNAVAIQPDQQILIGGNFSSYNGTLRGRIARVNTNGTLDATFNPGAGANGLVRALALHSDTNHPGKVVVVGDFTLFAGNPYNRLARLNLDGTVDNTFNIGTGPDGTVLDVKIQDNGQIVIGGDFNNFNGQPASRIARLNPDGSLDETFQPGAGIDGTIHALELEPSLVSLEAPKVLIAGEFTQVDLRSRNRLARLNPDGSLDTSFDPGFGADDTVFDLMRQGDNTFLIGGLFHNYNGTRRLGLARVLNNGWLDTTFMDAAYNQFAGLPNRFSPLVESKNFVRSIALETNGNIMVGGSFRRVGGGNRNTQAFGPSSPWRDHGNNPINTPVWITRDDYRNRFNFARIIGGEIPGPGHVTFIQPEYAIDETAGFTFIQLARTNGQFTAAGAQFRTGDRPPGLGAASSPADYTSTPDLPIWTSTYPATRMQSESRQGVNNLTIPTADDIYISINDDTEVEGNEVFDMTLDLPQTFLTLGGEVIPVGAALGQTRATLTIVDDDVPPAVISFATNSFTVNEAEGTAELTVLRSGNVNATITVDFFTADGTALTTQDYTAQFGQITFGTGETEKTFQVPIINDVNAEFDETISLSLTNLTAGAVFGPGGQNSTLTIFDNDFATGQLRFSSAVYPATESDGVVSVVVQRTGGNAGAITVDLATVAGSAVDGTDFSNVATTLNWADGDTSSRTVNIPVLTDGLVDGAKVFTVGLTNARVLATSVPVPVAGANPATVTLADVDAFGSLQFASASYSVAESGGQAIITVTRTGGNSGTVQVNYQTSAGSAVAGVDYLNTNGTLVLGPGVSSATFALAILDNALQNTNVNGSFNRTVILDLSTFINGTAGTPVTAVLTIVDDERFNEPAGSVDTTYNGAAGANETIYSLALQPDGRLLIGGEFTSFNGLGRTRIARLDKGGLLDPTFDPGLGANGTVRALALQDDGRLLVGGIFTNLDGVVRNRIGRLNQDGSLDEAYDPGAGADNPVYAIALHRDSAHLGKAVVGGAFATMDGVSRPFVARLNVNGTVDLGFNPGTGADGTVFAVAIQSDGRVLVGGDFTTFNGVPSAGIARLNPDGSVDAAFAAALGSGANASVRSIVVQGDGRILLGGLFTDFNGAPLNNLARLLATGAVDPSFTPGVGGDKSVLALALQPDGKILVAGDFENFSGVTRSRLTRLLPDGTVDATINFGTGADAFIAAIAVQLDDNKIIVGGGFTSFNDQPRNRLARLHGGVIAGPGRLEFRRPVFSANEDGTNVIVFVRRLGGLTGAVGLDVSTASGTALAGVDFTNVLTTLSFPNGEGLRQVLVPVVSDTEPEGNEVFNLALANITGGATAGPQPAATAVIVDDDGSFFFSSPVFSVNENIVTGQAQITVRRTAGTNAVATVALTSADFTARDGEDYSGVTNVVITFQPGQTTRSVQVPIIDDLLGEGNESATLTLADPVGGSLGAPATATLTIVDNEFSPGVIQFSQVAYQVDETGGSAVINVQRLAGTSGLVSAQFIANGNTATPGADYTPTATSLSFSDGETNKTVIIPILDDLLPESDETIDLILTNLTGGATLGSNAAAVLTIIDNEVLIRFSETNYFSSESNLIASITVNRFGGTNSTVGATVATVPGGTATADVDYVSVAPTVLNFPPGVTALNVDVIVNDDFFVEGDETVNLALSSPFGGAQVQPATGSAVLTIVDNDSIVSFTTNQFTVDETNGTATLTLVRAGNLSFDAIVSYAVTAGSATAGVDFIAETNVVNFLAGETNQVISVSIIDDGLVEGGETVNVELLGGVGASVGGTNTATLTIIDDDAFGTLSFESSSFAVIEGGLFATINVVRQGGSAGAVSVNYSTADGSALAGSDYNAANGVLAFAAGETNKSFLVPILDDAEVEGDETVVLTLGNVAGGASLGAVPVAVLTITDDDFFGTLQFSAAGFSASEGAGQAVVTVSRVGGAAGAVSVNFSVVPGTAQVPGDFALTNGTLSWAAGDATDKSFTVRLSDDSVGEFDETVLMSLAGVTGGATLGTPDVAVLTITDNDLSVAFSSASYAVSETGLVAVITVNRLGLTNGAVSVDYTTTNALGTATAGVDFTNRTGTLFWADGDGSAKTFTVPVVDDTTIEGDETVNLDLLNPVGATLTFPMQAVLNVVDNDVSPFFTSAGARLVADPNGNGVIDPGETVTVSLAVRNVSTTNSVSLLGSLVPTNGVTTPSASQGYGAVLAGGPSVARNFSFTAGASNGATMTAILQLQDGAQNLGAVPFVFQIGTRTNKFLNGGAIAIVDDGPAQPYPSVVSVSGVPGTVSKVTVTVSNLSHGFPLDIDMLLVSPTGQRVILLSDAGGSAAAPNAINNVTLKFDDAAPTGLGQTNLIVSGTYKPSNFSPAEFFVPPAPTNGYASTLSTFNGINPNGQWLLYILDDDFIASGSIASGWCLEIATAGLVNPPGDLKLSGGYTPAPDAIAGAPVTYTLTVSNAGSTIANHVVLSNTLPAGFAYSSVVNPHGGQYLSGDHAVLQLGTLGIGATKSVTIVADTTAPGNVTDLAGVTSSLTDSVPADNNLALLTTVIEAVDLGVFLSDAPDPVVVNTAVAYTIVVTNRGPSVAVNLVLTNRLPATTTFLSATTSAGSVAHAAGLVTANLGSLAGGASATVTINATPTAVGTITDAAGVVTTVSELNPADNEASVKTTVIAAPTVTQRVIGGSLVFTWPVEAGNFTLVFTDTLTPPVMWQPVGVAPTVVGNQLFIAIPIDAVALSRFYTLQQTP